ncbi:MAG: hypothetical protein OEZ58_01370 [Gammaproteobacteria bacterium]|nr:hypothetical protein [Gammaproteobacteria bacterium]
MSRRTSLILLLFVLLFSQALFAEKLQRNETDLWLAKKAGIWQHGDDVGFFQAKVYRQGSEHAHDRVVIVVTQVVGKEGEEKMIHQFELPTPGIKAYVQDLKLKALDDKRMALFLDLEMKAMDGVVLREVYLLNRLGKYKRISEAKYVDIYDWQ